MFDTTLGYLIGLVIQLSWLLVSHGFCQMVQHPLLASVLCLVLGHAQQMGQKTLRERFRWVLQYLMIWITHSDLATDDSNFGHDMADQREGGLEGLDEAGFQSPINIDDRQLSPMAIKELLNWNHYDELPASIQVGNTGHILILRAQFHGNTPTISGADLLASYSFVEVRFHWGWSNSEGSEHTFNHRKFPMEMQVMHRASSWMSRSCTSSYDLLTIAYMFELSAHNPFLDPLVQNLRQVQQPGKAVNILPFPLCYLMPPFRAGFYSYGGSLTRPPFYEGTEWFIFPETLAISDFQLRHFRQLLSHDGVTPITRNARPVQALRNRSINLNLFSPMNTNQLASLPVVGLCQQQQAADVQKEEPVEKVEEQQRGAAPADSEEEGELMEYMDTTTVITSDSTNMCMTTFLRKEQLPDCSTTAIVIHSDSTSSDMCAPHPVGGPGSEPKASCNADAICGVGDGINIAVYHGLVE
ncbi:carbonic anhydrase 1 [Drosophila miranda]|uniref:carbonic anhydrase 1 n=1 Tax=Drosophila miranda TaxID=7229 RepID=UPI00143F4948|nr:carbonic anhydrase 1 [Drosophila miranda]